MDHIRTPRTAGFTLIEVMISGLLLAMLMLAVMGLVSQAQQDMQKTAVQTEVTEKTRRTMWRISQELTESSFDMLICGGRSKSSGGTGTATNYVQSSTEANMSQCSDDQCPWMYNASATTYYEKELTLGRRVSLDYGHTSASSTPSVLDTTNLGSSGHNMSHSILGRIWVGRNGGTSCPAGHTITATTTSTVDFGIIMFASPRNRNGRFVSAEGADLGTDWQSLVFYAPYAVGGNVTELRRYVLYIDDLLDSGDGVAAWSDSSGQGWVAPFANETQNVSGAGAGGSAFSTNTPVGKPTMLDLLDYDADGAIADGTTETDASSEPDATDEQLAIVVSAGDSLITYTKRDTANGRNFALTIDRRTGEINVSVNHTYGSGDTFVRTVQITGRTPEVIASRITDIEFATIRNCPFRDDSTGSSSDENETGLLSGQDATVVRITALFDKMLGRVQGGISGSNVVERQVTSQELVVTRVQPRN